MDLSAKFPELPTLYCITDCGISGMSHEEQVKQMLSGGARLIQIREKIRPLKEIIPEVRRCRELCTEAGATLIINDNFELAAMVQAAGVHLGQNDEPPARVREVLGGGFLIGRSTHNWQEFQRALDEPVDYIAVGPVFETSSKEKPEPVIGLELVQRAARALERDGRPLVCIGGINADNLGDVLAAAPQAIIAVIGAVLKEGDIGENVARLMAELNKFTLARPESSTLPQGLRADRGNFSPCT